MAKFVLSANVSGALAAVQRTGILNAKNRPVVAEQGKVSRAMLMFQPVIRVQEVPLGTSNLALGVE